MAVTYIQGNNGMLGTLGALATLGGTVMPQARWLTPLGLGIGAANSAMNGDAEGSLKTMNKLAKMKMKNPPPNVASPSPKTDDELSNKWSPFLYGGWGNNPWQQ